MNTILEWFNRLDTAARLQLLETAAYFDPESYNSVFRKELEELLNRITDEGARQEIMDLRGFDFSNYILNSLKRAGIRDDDAQQEDFHNIVVRLLVSPGKLFKGWVPGKHGPLVRRFKAATWNSIRNLISKQRNRRKWMQTADPVAIAERTPERASQSQEIIDVFRQLVKERLGQTAADILDQRLNHGNLKKMAEIGTVSAFYVKKEVQAIKDLADRFAFRIGDSKFAQMVSRAMERESATIEKRKTAMAAKSA
jgi:hypothetical protein